MTDEEDEVEELAQFLARRERMTKPPLSYYTCVSNAVRYDLEAQLGDDPDQTNKCLARTWWLLADNCALFSGDLVGIEPDKPEGVA